MSNKEEYTEGEILATIFENIIKELKEIKETTKENNKLLKQILNKK